MGDVLTAGSPVEIEAKAAEAGLAEADRDAALALFHDLTSRLELRLLATPADGGENWPRHRFWFGPAAAVGAITARLRASGEAAEAPATAAIVFVTADDGPFAGLLAAGSRPGWLSALDGPA